MIPQRLRAPAGVKWQQVLQDAGCDFRNTYVAHHDKELSDKVLAERSLKHWVETLVLLRL